MLCWWLRWLELLDWGILQLIAKYERLCLLTQRHRRSFNLLLLHAEQISRGLCLVAYCLIGS
jgi:hypothetical protein